MFDRLRIWPQIRDRILSGPLGPHVDPYLSALERDGIDIKHQSRRTFLIRGLGVEHLGFTERQLEGLRALRVLVQQIAQIGGRLMCGRDGEEHVLIPCALGAQGGPTHAA